MTKKLQEPKVVLSISKLMPHKFSMTDQSHRKRYPSFNKIMEIIYGYQTNKKGKDK
jgi:hypothetical protein